jgi:hypothetical protein
MQVNDANDFAPDPPLFRARMEYNFTPAEISKYYAARVPDLPQRGTEWRGGCPIHHGKDPNFAVNPETGQSYCHSQCGRGWDIISLEMELSGVDFSHALARVEAIVGRVQNGQQKRRIVAIYPYDDEDGKMLFEVVRFEPKGFAQRRPDGAGGWIWNTNGVRPVPYRLPELLAAKAAFVIEGEKDVDSIEQLGLTGTCNPTGAGKWREDYAQYFCAKRIVIVPDNDAPGRKHALTVADSILHTAESVRIMEVPRGKDVTEFITSGGTRDELLQLARAAEELTAEKLEALGRRWFPTREDNRVSGVDRVDNESTPASYNWPEPLAAEALQGLAGEFVRLVEPHSESDPAALLIQFLVGFGNLIGRSPPRYRIPSPSHEPLRLASGSDLERPQGYVLGPGLNVSWKG